MFWPQSITNSPIKVRCDPIAIAATFWMVMKKVSVALLALIGAIAPVAPAAAGMLGDVEACARDESAVLVRVDGFKVRAGALRVQIYGSNPADFLAKGKKLARVDVPVARDRAFVFTTDGGATYGRASSLREFTAAVASRPAAQLDGFLRRGDFSRWIADVFSDNALAAELRAIDDQYRLGRVSDVADSIVHTIEARYEVTEG